MKKFWVIRKDSGLKSGSREVSLTEALKYLVYNLVQVKSVLPQSSEALKSGLKIWFKKNLSLAKVKGCRRGPVAMMRGSNMGYPTLLVYHIIDHMGASIYKAEF